MEGSVLLPGYDPRKAAQVTAYFALRAGGQINVLKLSKLLYLAEREFMARHDVPMFYDNLASMPDGPVASVTLNLINGNLEHAEWSKYIGPREGYTIRVATSNLGTGDLDDLSRADVEILESLWDRFGSMDKYTLRDYTHVKDNIPEWEDPEGSSRHIPHEKVFACLKKTNSKELAAEVISVRQLHRRLSEA
jgi:uncharacterized phage-associated protein